MANSCGTDILIQAPDKKAAADFYVKAFRGFRPLRRTLPWAIFDTSFREPGTRI